MQQLHPVVQIWSPTSTIFHYGSWGSWGQLTAASGGGEFWTQEWIHQMGCWAQDPLEVLRIWTHILKKCSMYGIFANIYHHKIWQTYTYTYNYIYIYKWYSIHIYIYITKASRRPGLEYRYKRSEANLGGVGGGGPKSVRFWKVRPEPGGGELKNRPAVCLVFWARTRCSILDTCWWFSTVFIGFQTPKHCNLRCFCAFGLAKVRLATCWKLRKYHCFC